MEFLMGKMMLLQYLSPVLALVCAPFLLGIINRTKAVFAGRKGQPLLQTYFDIAKLLRKGAVYSTTTSWLFRAGPIVSLAAVVVACFIIPIGKCGAPISFTGDIVLFMYLLGIARFFVVLAALDTGSPFEGMGASREVFFSVLAEPVFLLCILALAHTHDLRFFSILGGMSPYAIVPALLAGISLFVVMLAENARIPIDDPTTHLELTMIHEVMVLDHGGPDFALITYGSALKLWLFGLVVVRAILPFHPASMLLDCSITLCTMAVCAVIVGIVESVTARLRLLRVPQLLIGAAALAALALFAGEGGLFL